LGCGFASAKGKPLGIIEAGLFTGWILFVFSTNSKVPICIALYHEQLTSKALRDHSFTFHPHIYLQVD